LLDVKKGKKNSEIVILQTTVCKNVQIFQKKPKNEVHSVNPVNSVNSGSDNFYILNMAKSPRFVPLAVMLYASLLFSCAFDNERNDGTVKIGTQTWMAENLNYSISGSKCYDDDEANCVIYGRLYDWATAMALPSYCNSYTCSERINIPHQGICPKGWHIPSDDEWRILIKFVGKNAGTKLKATSGWDFYEGIISGADTYGFAALPGGWGDFDGSFNSIGVGGYWWSSLEISDNYASYRGLFYANETVNEGYGKSYFHSIRCLKD